LRFFNATFKEVNLSVDVFRKSGDGKTPVFRYTSVDVIDGEINLEIKNTFSWYAKLKNIKETLLHLAYGEGIIRLINKKDPNENIYLDFLFQRKEKGGQLTVI
jgi:hypothetical protein